MVDELLLPGHNLERRRGPPPHDGSARNRFDSPRANGRDSSAPNAASCDESKVTIYPSLPDPLLTQDRRRVDSPEMGWSVRRPEIVELFDREVYGRVPENVPAVTWSVVATSRSTTGDIAFRQHSGGHTDGPNWPTFIAFAARYLDAPSTDPTAKNPTE